MCATISVLYTGLVDVYYTLLSYVFTNTVAHTFVRPLTHTQKHFINTVDKPALVIANVSGPHCVAWQVKLCWLKPIIYSSLLMDMLIL